MNVLAIGNSFSQDATRYLHGIARADGEKLNVVNLYIGGCSLERHYRNMLSDEKAYALEYNGHKTGFFISLSEALLNRSWDVITLQQVSSQSFKRESYDPYIISLAAYVRKCSPAAKLYIHQTWAYEDGSDKLMSIAGYKSSEKMLSDVINTYEDVFSAVSANGIIRSGEIMGAINGRIEGSIYRDGCHASEGIGRYALALTWYRTLYGKSVINNSFSDFDKAISDADIATVKKCIEERI